MAKIWPKVAYQPELSKKVTNKTLNKIISIESAGKSKAKARTSSAGGLFQFLKGTFSDTAKKHYPKWFKGRTLDQVQKLRFDPEYAIEAGVKFTEDNADALGKGWTEGDLYLAHFLGIGAARKLLRSPRGTPVRDFLDPKAITANESILRGKNAGQVRDWAQWSMDKRWKDLGYPDWIGLWYTKDDNVKPPPPEVVAKNSQPLGNKVEKEDGSLLDADGDGIPDHLQKAPVDIEEGTFEEAPAEVEAPEDGAEEEEPQLVIVSRLKPTGDNAIWMTQVVLKSMNYAPGMIDGKWGGMTAGSIANFINDRNSEIVPPTSSQAFKGVWKELKKELAEAQEEQFVRPVSQERATADDEKVEEVAPEHAPVRKNFWVTIWGSIVAGGAAVVNTVKDWFGSAFDFYTDNQDTVDTVKESGWLDTIWTWLSDLPVTVWLVAIAGLLVYVALNSRAAAVKIAEDVKTGVRK